MPIKPKTIDDYLKPLSSENRSALEKLRRDIKAAAPAAEECISYGLAALRLNGKFLVAFGAAANHCAFYPGASPIRSLNDALKSYDTSKGTIRFQPDRPLSTTLVRKLVRIRLAKRAAQSRSKGVSARAR